MIVLPSHPRLHHFHPVAAELRRKVAARGQRLVSFDPFLPGHALKAEFYPGDAFFIPFSGLENVMRGGPALEVWTLPAQSPALQSERVPGPRTRP